MISARLEPSSSLRGDLGSIIDAAERAAALTRQLLAFSRKQVLQPRTLDLNAVVREIAPMLQRVIGDDIRTDTSLDPDLGHIHADRGQIEQVVMNLVVNARDAMERGGTLTIATRNVVGTDAEHAADEEAAPRVLLSVSDTGKGMDAATRAKAFEPFFTTKPVGQGTGLGLSTVYGVVEQSHGRVSLVSEFGAGTTVEISFPREDRPAPPAAARAVAVEPTPGSEVILLAEDQRAVRAICRRVLEQQGHTVLEAQDGREAIELGRSFPGHIDLLVTDMTMPEHNGREVHAQLLRSRPALRVLFISGHTEDEAFRRGEPPPGSTLLLKPFSGAQLVAAVRAILDAPRDAARPASPPGAHEVT